MNLRRHCFSAENAKASVSACERSALLRKIHFFKAAEHRRSRFHRSHDILLRFNRRAEPFRKAHKGGPGAARRGKWVVFVEAQTNAHALRFFKHFSDKSVLLRVKIGKLIYINAFPVKNGAAASKLSGKRYDILGVGSSALRKARIICIKNGFAVGKLFFKHGVIGIGARLFKHFRRDVITPERCYQPGRRRRKHFFSDKPVKQAHFFRRQFRCAEAYQHFADGVIRNDSVSGAAFRNDFPRKLPKAHNLGAAEAAHSEPFDYFLFGRKRILLRNKIYCVRNACHVVKHEACFAASGAAAYYLQ